MTLEQLWHRVPGGTATSILGLARALAGPDVDLVGVAARHDGPPPADDLRPPIPVAHLPLPRALLYEAWHRIGRPDVERATGRVDVVHATTAAIPPSRKAPLVATVHDLAFVADPTGFTSHGVRFFERGTALAKRHARVVVVPSEATARECRDEGFDPARIRVVAWGHDGTPATPAAVADVRRRHGLDGPYVLFVGTQEPRKNLDRLVQAWRAATEQQVPLVLAGPVGWGDAAPTGDGIRILGTVSFADRDALYAGAAAVAYPSLREGFGLPVLEAMAQGAPVLTSRGTATEEVAGDAAVLVDPHDVDDIAAGLRRLLDDPDPDLRTRATARAATYTWARCADGYRAAYREALD